jgi:hypothetical protein
MHRFSTLYHQSVLGYNNRLVAENSNPTNARRRSRRQWSSDLPQPADEKKLKSPYSLHTACKVSSAYDSSTQDTCLEQIYSLLQKKRVDCKYIIYK